MEVVPDASCCSENPLASSCCGDSDLCADDDNRSVVDGVVRAPSPDPLVIGNDEPTVTVGAYKLHLMQMQIDGLKKYVDAQHAVLKELWAQRNKACIGCEAINK